MYSSIITLIMNRFRECGKDLLALKQMSPAEVEELCYPPEKSYFLKYGLQ